MTPLARYRATGEIIRPFGKRANTSRSERSDELPDERLWSSWTHGSYGEPDAWNESSSVERYTGVIYIATNKVANRIAKLWRTNWLCATLTDGEEAEIERAQILTALARPNPIDKTGSSLAKRTWVWLGTTGNAYWYIMRDAIGAPRGFWPFFPHLTRVVVTPDEFVVGVNYYPDGLGGTPDFFPIEDVIHFKLENPHDNLYGWSPARAHAYETNTAEAIRVYESAWFKNQMRPDYVVSVGGIGGPDVMGDLERVRARFRMYHQGSRRFGEPLFLPPDSKIQQIQFSLADSQFLELSGATEDRIYQMHNIPKWVVKPEGFATRAAATEAKIEFAEDCIEPAAGVIYDTLNVCLINDPRNVPRPDNVAELELRHDSAAPTDVEFRNADARENFKAGLLSKDEARSVIEWDAVSDGTGGEYASPNASPFAQAQAATDTAAQPKGFDPGFAEAVAVAVAKQLRPAPLAVETRELNTREIVHPRLDTEEKRADFWAKAIKPQDDHAVAATAVLRSFFRRQADRVLPDIRRNVERLTAKHAGWSRARTIKALAHAERVSPLVVKMGKDDAGIDIPDERDRLVDTLRPITRSAAQDGGDLLARQLGLAWDIENPKAARWLETHVAQTAEDITDTSAQLLSATIRDGVADGKSTSEIMRDLRTVFTSWSEQGAESESVLPGYRAARIARTEIGTAFGRSQQLVLEDAKDEGIVESKMWISARDEHVRDSHRIDGETVDVSGEFSNGLKYPGDPSAGPGEICNCVAPGTLVSGRITGAFRARYAGRMREVRTASGRLLRITPNHPVLTPDGFVPAGALRKGDYVLADLFQAPGVSRVDVKSAPSRVEDVFQALAERFDSFTYQPVRLDLHGDAEFVKGEIDIVRADSELLDYRNAVGAEPFGQIGLVSALPKSPGLKCGGSFQPNIHGVSLPSSRSVGLRDLRGSAIANHGGPLDLLGVGPAANFDASRYESRAEAGSGDSGFVAELLERSAGQVATDQIVDVRDFDFLGHVYDLQTIGGFYTSSGILNSNCRCTIAAVVARG